MIADVLLDSLLQKQLADTIPEHTEDCLQRFTKDLRQEVSGILALQIAAVELNCLFHKLALAAASILSIETFDRRFGFRHEPEREFDFLVCHANFPPILCATPLFSLKQRDYLRFRPQQGCFCPLNNPCPKAPNCPHCGQMCLPRCAHDTLAFSCYNSSIGKTRIKMQTFRIIAKNPSHENAASKLVLAAVRFFILAVLIRFKQHSAPPYETTFLPFFSLPLSARRCAMI